ncbi:minor capsid protein [Clostridium sp. MSJ-11]|uniref:Minor capsid protein n=1 Tax=Clostridium mobile TaxID=2841512 RepID=A0ABS6EMN1_9CLOT|nr:minor capsid protein [Clostridium mobile]MBU5486483.1 minor capsid protein [Clostridium mobile]
MRNKAYWKKRSEVVASKQFKKTDDYILGLQLEYQEALSSIQKDIEVFYQRFATNNEITLGEARRLLNSNELQEFKMDLKEFTKKAKNNKNLEWEKELNNVSYKVRVTRLQALQTQIRNQIELLYSNQSKDTTKLLGDIYQDTYYRNIYEVHKGLGIGVNFAKLDTNTVNKVLAEPWQGANYSSRIWTNKDKLIMELQTNLVQSFIRGDSIDRTAKVIAERMNVARNRARTLVNTESANIVSKATFNSYSGSGVVKQYEILATLDLRTSKICREMDGKVFKVSEKEIGINAPPFHANCRTTTVAYFDDAIDEERIARDNNGKVYYVDGNIKYEDWYSKHVVNNGNNDIIKEKVIKELKYPEIKTISEAEKWAKDNLSLNTVSYKGIDVDVANYVNKSMNEIYEEYPLLNGFVQEIKADGRAKAPASAVLSFKDGKLNTKLVLSKNDLSNLESIDAMIQRCVDDKWWTPKDGVKGIIKHEMGHMIEYATTLKKYGVISSKKELDDLSNLSTAFNKIKNGELSKEIKVKALNNLNIVSTKKNVKENLSDYANHSTLEFLAESVSEHNPRPLAKEVIKLLREKIKEVWK